MIDTYVLHKSGQQLILTPAPNLKMRAKSNAFVGGNTSPEIRNALTAYAADLSAGEKYSHLLKLETVEDFQLFAGLTVVSYELVQPQEYEYRYGEFRILLEYRSAPGVEGWTYRIPRLPGRSYERYGYGFNSAEEAKAAAIAFVRLQVQRIIESSHKQIKEMKALLRSLPQEDQPEA